MGLSASKQVKSSLANSSEFDSACNSAFTHCLFLSQHNLIDEFLPYQLLTASDLIHHSLLSHHGPHHSLIVKWAPYPPILSEVLSAFHKVNRHHPDPYGYEPLDVIGSTRFKEWALVLYVDAVMNNAGQAVRSRVLIGIAGIAGIGALIGFPINFIGTTIGVYAVGVATSIYLSLSGSG